MAEAKKQLSEVPDSLLIREPDSNELPTPLPTKPVRGIHKVPDLRQFRFLSRAWRRHTGHAGGPRMSIREGATFNELAGPGQAERSPQGHSRRERQRAGSARASSPAGWRSALQRGASHRRPRRRRARGERPELPRTETPSRSSENGLEPKKAAGVKVMSVALFTGDESGPPGRRQTRRTSSSSSSPSRNWGPLDYLVVDLPPSTGDELRSVLRLFAEKSTLVLVTTPSPARPERRISSEAACGL